MAAAVENPMLATTDLPEEDSVEEAADQSTTQAVRKLRHLDLYRVMLFSGTKGPFLVRFGFTAMLAVNWAVVAHFVPITLTGRSERIPEDVSLQVACVGGYSERSAARPPSQTDSAMRFVTDTTAFVARSDTGCRTGPQHHDGI